MHDTGFGRQDRPEPGGVARPEPMLGNLRRQRIEDVRMVDDQAGVAPIRDQILEQVRPQGVGFSQAFRRDRRHRAQIACE